MKKLVLLSCFLGSIAFLYAQSPQTISADSINSYEGKLVTVCEKVVDTHVTKESKVTYLNMGHPYPAQSFTLVIFASDAPHFPYDPAVYLKGKSVCITGTVKLYKDRPEIIVNRPEQLQVKE